MPHPAQRACSEPQPGEAAAGTEPRRVVLQESDRSARMAAPFVFLSHSGADTEAARKLKDRLVAGPDARAAGLRVWFDKDDLRPGTPWSAQIAEAIQKATAFVVYVGSGGVMNWVEAEVDLALSRGAVHFFIFLFSGDRLFGSAAARWPLCRSRSAV